jgi:hypothetical protein
MLRMKEELLSKDQYELEMNRVGIISGPSNMLQSLSGGASLHEGVGLTHGNPEVSKALELLDAKLNYVIGMSVLQKTDDADLKERLVNMSATGMRFTTKEFCKKGEHLKITMSLPLSPPVLLELVAEVVYIKVRDGRTQVGVAFIFRCEEEEDSVIRYIFKRQRETIRMKYREKVRHSRLNDEDLV